MTNTYIAPGEPSPEAMIAEVEKRLLRGLLRRRPGRPGDRRLRLRRLRGLPDRGRQGDPPCRGATLIGNCLDALAAIDAVGDDFLMKTGICGKGGQKVPVGTGQGHVRVGDDGRGDRGVIDARARPARSRRPPAAGASDAEAYAGRDSGREVRVHGGEVESLTAATQTRDRHPRLDRPPGRLRLRHRPLRGGRRGDRRPRRRGGRGRRRGRVRGAAARRQEIEALAGLERPDASPSGPPTRSPSWR